MQARAIGIGFFSVLVAAAACGTHAASDNGPTAEATDPAPGPAPGTGTSSSSGAIVDPDPTMDAGEDASALCPEDRQRCQVTFVTSASNEGAVELRGNFAPGGWVRGLPMMRAGSEWRVTTPIATDKRVEYKFCIDPRSDGSCSSWRANASMPTTPPDGNNVIDRVQCVARDCAPERTDVRFVALGDTGKGNAGQYEVARAMATKCAASGCDFGMLLGDNIYDSGASSATDPLFDSRFESVYASVGVPFYAILGNHDYGGNGAGNEFSKGQFEIDHTAHSTIWKMPTAYYQFAKGNASFFALDTNMQLYARDAQQRVDVADWIARSTSTWKIAFGHHPYISNGPHGNAGTYDNAPVVPVFNGKSVKSFAEDVYCGKVDLYLCGHDHSRQWMTNTCRGTEFAVSGAGASPSSLPGNGPSRFQSTGLGFLYVVIDGRTLTAEFYDAAGNVSFTRTLTK